MTTLNNVFGITLELMSTRSSISFDQAGLNLSYIVQGDSDSHIKILADDLIQKLNLLATIQLRCKATPFILKEIVPMHDLSSITSLSGLFFELEPSLFNKFLHYSHIEEFFVLIEAFDDLKDKKLFDAFPKFVNWLDYHDYDNAPQQKFCVIRSALSHTSFDNKDMALKKFPKLEFTGKIFVRQDRNRRELIKLMPELLLLVKQRFRKILEDIESD